MRLPALTSLLLCLLLASCKKHTALVNITLPASDMLQAVNGLRSTGCRCGQDTMPPTASLTWNNTLQKAASTYALDMYQRNYFSHISPEGSSPILRAQAQGYTGQYVGENIGRGYNSVTTVVAAWLASEAHCKAMMDTLYRQMGAGRANDYWVLELGR